MKTLVRYMGWPLKTVSHGGAVVQLERGCVRELIQARRLASRPEFEMLLSAHAAEEDEVEKQRAIETGADWCQDTINLFYLNESIAWHEWRPING